MTVSAQALEVLIYSAVVLAAVAPVALAFLWIKDKLGGKLW